jgi:hypothetical protein
MKDLNLLIQECEKLAKELLLQHPNITIDNTWYYDYTHCRVGVSFKTSENKLYNEASQAIFIKITKTKFSNFTYSFLHELGHYYNHYFGKFNLETYFEENAIAFALNLAVENKEMSYMEAMEKYYNLPLERRANRYMKTVIKNWYNTISIFDNKIKELLSP